MASVKNLKKDIDLVMSLALSDCFYVLEYNSKVDEKAVMKIAGDIIRAHRELRLKVNHPDGKDNPKLVKQFYKKLVKDTLQAADNCLEKLSSEVKKVAKD
jgi:signal recognition particle subunit SEC65